MFLNALESQSTLDAETLSLNKIKLTLSCLLILLEVHVTCQFKTANIIKLTLIVNNGISNRDNYLIPYQNPKQKYPKER